ncbi:MAG TPA: GMP/IMP nucleotidase [Gammaproteobacteria bacterium]|nr:GMP/IMP nucleotidase [Gammaproteobacteria bacterium]
MTPTAKNASAAPEWAAIDTVLLDMDGTVLDLGFDSYFWREYLPRRYCETHGVAAAVASGVLEPLFESHRGTLNWYCLDFWSRELRLDVAALKCEVADRICFLSEAPRFLEAVRGLGKRLVLVTNAHPGSLELKQARTGLGRHFDTMVSAHALGFPKEDVGFWTRLVALEDFDPARTLFVDDSLPVLRAAREFGIRWLVAIRRPDSRRPARDVPGFPAVDALHELIPARTG